MGKHEVPGAGAMGAGDTGDASWPAGAMVGVVGRRWEGKEEREGSRRERGKLALWPPDWTSSRVLEVRRLL